jgi:signal transduction histidine kinase
MVLSVSALRDGQNNIIGYLLIGTDNTAQKQIEAERATLNQALEDRNADLEYAKVVAEKANLAKSEFLSSMSHELRTPLGAILGFAQLLESGTPSPTPTQKLSVDQILKAGWYLLELINEILDLAKIESGKVALSLEPISLAEVMQDCRYMVEAQAEKRSVSMIYPQFGLPTFVQADQKRLKQILVNLLSNAIKYNQVGGTVEVSCHGSSPGRLRICVQDTGAGLARSRSPSCFSPSIALAKERARSRAPASAWWSASGWSN